MKKAVYDDSTAKLDSQFLDVRLVHRVDVTDEAT